MVVGKCIKDKPAHSDLTIKKAGVARCGEYDLTIKQGALCTEGTIFYQPLVF